MIGRALRGLGELFITVGVVLLLLVVYELYVTGIFAARTQRELHHDLAIEWAKPGLDPVALGQGLAILRIPVFGRSYDPVIVQGTDTADLEKGPGHVVGTAMPGQVGNFSVSGHRTTWGHWFYNLNELHAGDPVVIQTKTMFYVYRVTTTEIVSPDDTAVIAPVPDHPDARPTQRFFTFTTCNPRYSASQRLIVHGLLSSASPSAKGPPAVLGVAS